MCQKSLCQLQQNILQKAHNCIQHKLGPLVARSVCLMSMLRQPDDYAMDAAAKLSAGSSQGLALSEDDETEVNQDDSPPCTPPAPSRPRLSMQEVQQLSALQLAMGDESKAVSYVDVLSALDCNKESDDEASAACDSPASPGSDCAAVDLACAEAGAEAGPLDEKAQSSMVSVEEHIEIEVVVPQTSTHIGYRVCILSRALPALHASS